MSQIRIEEIVGYLPYGLMCQVTDQGIITTSKLSAIYDDCTFSFCYLVESEHGFEDVKPLLYPLSSITDYREDLGMSFIEHLADMPHPDFYLFKDSEVVFDPETLSWDIYWNTKEDGLVANCHLLTYQESIYMYKHHIDIHNLISRGLAVDIRRLGGLGHHIS